jgi:hypothetical protein
MTDTGVAIILGDLSDRSEESPAVFENFAAFRMPGVDVYIPVRFCMLSLACVP